ncbi:MAG: ABC transporter permease [Synechococcaceae cyanobacterium]|nr:ABC transporter permease [Synechococcaceae cyanobacterium]
MSGPRRPGRGAAWAWLGRWRERLLIAWAVAVYALLFTPIATVVLFSFNQPRGRFNLLWQGFTLANWLQPLRDRALSEALVTSLGIAALAALLATLLGGLMALVLARRPLRGGTWLEILLILPLASPEIVLASALLNLFVQLNLERGPLTLVLSHSLVGLSYAALILRSRLEGFDWNLEAAAMDLGARPLAVFRRVTLPLIAPGVLAAALVAFSLSLDDVIVAQFTAGRTVTLPLYIAGAFQREISPQIHVLATLVLLISVGLLGLANGVVSRGDTGPSGRPRA